MKRRLLFLFVLLALSGCTKKKYRMPSSSMVPTLPPGMLVTADSTQKTPMRGDVFVFKYPEHPDQMFVKRIVGLPGDHVEMRGHLLSIGGKPVLSCAIGPYSFTDESKHDGDLFLEGDGYLVFYENGAGGMSDGTWTVASGEYWAMGDNRNNSHDSRSWFGGKGGGVPEALLQGRVEGARAVLPGNAGALTTAFEKCKKELGVR